MLKLRVITALILAPLVLLAIFAVPHTVTAAVLGVLVLLGAWEWSAFPGFKRRSTRILYLLVFAALLSTLWRIGEAAGQLDVILLAAVVWWGVGPGWGGVRGGRG